ncbi:MAG TPA: SDR family NAD(P)-dependent oxidoreductase, partial [Acidimicrobiales bacterium]
MDLGIAGRVALVVAGSRGLGRATAQALAAEGVRVMLSARSGDTLAEARATLRATGAEVETQVADITDPESPARLVEATREAFGGLDIVIANAGGPP